jgi:hypothetical protein
MKMSSTKAATGGNKAVPAVKILDASPACLSLLSCICLSLTFISAWSPTAPITSRKSSALLLFHPQLPPRLQLQRVSVLSSSTRPWLATPLAAAKGGSNKKTGFGSGSSSSETKLKPKAQWDRYKIDLKKESKFRVAVRPILTDSEATASEWLEVGSVKSLNNDYTEYSVARQRALIVEVSCGPVLRPVRALSHPKLIWLNLFTRIHRAARPSPVSPSGVNQRCR